MAIGDLYREQFLKEGVLDTIRKCPPLWINSRSITRLNAFLDGHYVAIDLYQPELARAVRREDWGMHEWTAYRLGFFESTSGYANMILERFRDESLGLDQFYELLDEFRAREANIVASIPGKLDAELAEIVTFTANHGFFVRDSKAVSIGWVGKFWPDWEVFSYLGGLSLDNITVLDEATFNRLLTQPLDPRCKQ